MTDDLVSRLRAHGPKRHDARALMNEAAAEIERLRARAERAENMHLPQATVEAVKSMMRCQEAFEAVHIRALRAEAALRWMRARDDENGSLPPAYRSKIDATLDAAPPQEATDWCVSDSLLAGRILNLLGIGADASLEPGADWRRDKVAKLIREHSDTLNPPAS